MNHWRPSSPPDAARRRAALLERIRRYFGDTGALAVDTPALSAFAGSDPNIDSFPVLETTGDTLFLHTSPEFCMKRLLAADYPDIYSICRVFRDCESGHRHLREFTMLEWYRLGYDLAAIVADTTNLIAVALRNPALHEGAQVLDYCEAFSRFAGIDALTASDDELAACAAADRDLRAAIGANRDAWLDLILATVIAPQFTIDRLTVVQHYPMSMAALARPCPGDARFSDRFEVFMAAMELANGYVELTDADEQRRRFANELEQRRNAGRKTPPQDELLLKALDAGLPACAGVAVGVERLQMILDRTDEIGDVVTFT